MAWLVIMYGADTEPLHAPAATTTPTRYTLTTTTPNLNRYQSIEIIAIAKKKGATLLQSEVCLRATATRVRTRTESGRCSGTSCIKADLEYSL